MIAFRCDSSFLIGSGHLSRCLSLAGQLQSLGHECVFFLRELEGVNTAALAKAGIEFRTIPAAAALEDEIALIAEAGPIWVVVDHYDLGIEWEIQAGKIARIFVIDDLFNRKHHCEALLDQNFRLQYSGLYQELVPNHCKVYLGPGYSLLPPSYSRSRDPKVFTNGIRKEVLVFFGGGDPSGEALKFCDAARGFEGSCHYTLVVTVAHRFLPELRKQGPTLNCTLLISPDNWVELLQKADFFFGSCGTVTWERFFFGLPGAVVTVAENQEQIAHDLQIAGLATNYGKAGSVDYSQLLPAIENEAQNELKLSEVSEKIRHLARRFPEKDLISLFGVSKEGQR